MYVTELDWSDWIYSFMYVIEIDSRNVKDFDWVFTNLNEFKRMFIESI